MKRLGRPPLKAKEKKEIFPLRLSALELRAIRAAAGDEPLAKWMRRKLLAAPTEQELANMDAAVKRDFKREKERELTARPTHKNEKLEEAKT